MCFTGKKLISIPSQGNKNAPHSCTVLGKVQVMPLCVTVCHLTSVQSPAFNIHLTH